MDPATRDGEMLRGIAPSRVDEIVEAEARQNGLEQALDPLRDEKCDGEPEQCRNDAWDGQRDHVEHVLGRLADRFDLQDVERSDGGKDDNDRGHRHPDRLGDRAAHWRNAVTGGAFTIDRDGLVAQAKPGAPGKPFDVDRTQRRFDDVPNNPRQYQAGKEKEAGTEQARQEGEDFVGK